MFIYGGVTELGDIEVTLDDCWSLDLNKRDNWKKVSAVFDLYVMWVSDVFCDVFCDVF